MRHPRMKDPCVQNRKEERPVDRGWAWVICFATFFINYLINNSYQVIAATLLDLAEKFDTSITVVSLIFTVKSFCTSIMSIVSVNFLVPKYGTRETCTVAGCVYFICGIAYVFAPNVEVFLLLATIRGLMIGMLFIPSVSLVGFYFKRHRSLAATLSFCGASVAFICWPPCTRYIISIFNLQGTFLINAAMEGNIIVFSLLLRPISSYRMPEHEDEDDKTSYEQQNSSNDKENTLIDPTFSSKNNKNHSKDNKKSSLTEDEYSESIKVEANEMKQFENIPDGSHHVTNGPKEADNKHENDITLSNISYNQIYENGHRTTVSNDHMTFLDYNESSPKDCLLSDCDSSNVTSASQNRNEGVIYDKQCSKPALACQTPKNRLSTTSLRNRKDQLLHPHTERTSPFPSAWSLASGMDGAVGVLSVEEIPPNKMTQQLTFLQKIIKLFDVSLFKNWGFLWLIIATVPSSFNPVIFSFLPTLATFKGVTKDEGALCLTILGAADLCSRMVIAPLADSKLLRVSTIAGIAMALLGTICIFVELVHGMRDLIIMCVFLGLFAGTRMSLLTIMYIDVVGVDNMAKAMSIHTLFVSSCAAGYNPLVGYLLETAGPDVVMYVMGVSIFVAGVFLWTTPLIMRVQKYCQAPKIVTSDDEIL